MEKQWNKISGWFVLVLALSLCVVSGPSLAGTELGNTINIAGRQRMLTQKMSKEILLIAAGIDKAGNTANLQKTANLFDSSLKGLKDFGNSGVAAQLKVVSGLWADFHQHVKSALAGDTSAAVLGKVAGENMSLLKNMNKAVQMYAKMAGSTMSQDLANTINVAGRQRMLTQKMSKEVMLIAAGIDKAGNTANLKKTANLFDNTLKGLKDFGNSDIAAQLKVVAGLWASFHGHVHSVATGNHSAAVLSSVATENMPLLKNMNKAVQMYAKMAK